MKSGSAGAGTIDEYIAAFPPDVQKILQQVRTTIRKAAPDAVEAIKYGIPTFVLGENLVHFGGFKPMSASIRLPPASRPSRKNCRLTRARRAPSSSLSTGACL